MSVTFSTGAVTLTLPNPTNGEGTTYDYGLVYYQKEDATIDTYNRYRSTKKLLQFNSLVQSDMEALQNFIRLYMGVRLTYTDFRGHTLSGYIISNPIQLTVVSRGKNVTCKRYTVTLEFESAMYERVP